MWACLLFTIYYYPLMCAVTVNDERGVGLDCLEYALLVQPVSTAYDRGERQIPGLDRAVLHSLKIGYDKIGDG